MEVPGQERRQRALGGDRGGDGEVEAQRQPRQRAR
jgi:hypothetical protein